MTSRSRISSIVRKAGSLTMKVASSGCNCCGECGCNTCPKAEQQPEASELREK